MSDDLYGADLMALARDGRHAAPPATTPPPEDLVEVRADNPLCGDRVLLFAQREGQDGLATLTHRVRGCAVCKAATTLVCAAIPANRTRLDALEAEVRAMLDGGPVPPTFSPLAPAARHASRHACVLLPFEALRRVWAEG
ncbi:MAG: iron-sulfur cluster assembly scaffold protein [Alphaproteobacteria bacterium]|nr:MAG: iron-sulfur cluster assembly scaffold protein [Alphaproteobacteria bacterium]